MTRGFANFQNLNIQKKFISSKKHVILPYFSGQKRNYFCRFLTFFSKIPNFWKKNRKIKRFDKRKSLPKMEKCQKFVESFFHQVEFVKILSKNSRNLSKLCKTLSKIGKKKQKFVETLQTFVETLQKFVETL